MGDSGSRRSTLVSRLPIFRRSISRRHDSLPSSPSSANAIGVHTSSPSSTNSSSGSTGKRRSIFRTPSISFHNKKGSEQKPDSASQNANISNGAQSSLSSFEKLSLEEHIKSRGRHSVSFSSSRSKKITRSLTDDFEKGKESSANKNVFINCISSGKNEGDDSGFAEEQSRYSVKQSTRKLLPKSFSSHYKFSKPVPETQSVSSVQQSRCLLEIKSYVESEPVIAKSSPPCSAETTECMGSSLQSPLLSTDLTAAQTPSDFVALTEDSISEVDALPSNGTRALLTEDFGLNVSTSQIIFNSAAAAAPARETDIVESTGHSGVSPVSHTSSCSVESNTLFKTSAANQTRVLLQANELHVNNARHTGEINAANAHLETFALQHREGPVIFSPKAQGSSRDRDESTLSQHMGKPIPVMESKIVPCSEPQSFKAQQGYETNHSKVDLANSFSPYREGRLVEKRLRSSSEGTAGGSRLVIKPKDENTEELNSLRKQRASSSSSKMNSMDVLNNLGSCELDEDDLMLDLEFTEEHHHHRSVCREDSYQSIVSCAAVVLTPVESTVDTRKKEQTVMPDVSKQNLSLKLSRDVDQGEARYPRVSQLAGSPSVEWPFTGLEEGGGIESLPFRLMLQDCTAVKTLLLKMKRVLQESTDMSPASSTTSLPVSPLPEDPLFFKDGIKDECSVLKLQLKERDELIAQLREELEKAQCFQKALASQADKSTQTDLVGHDALWNSPCSEGLVYKPISISLVPSLLN
ncbi:serine-rich coiled-coil domain-containing protein 1 isoform X2 [Phaenicophaeus curvirostris]|uniref:serine-rich coiled-coil domain-containing protein 1 isoform X2 n=1 Tax=Phaenicophaeus curvirostris TaxID=33595 RepID=UPI0037F099D2